MAEEKPVVYPTCRRSVHSVEPDSVAVESATLSLDRADPASSTGRVLEFDVLRGGALLYIVGFWHLAGYSPSLQFLRNETAELLAYCMLGLSCFLSGYLLAGQQRFTTVQDVSSFYARRFVRIYPPFFLAAVGFLWLGLVDGRTFLKGISLSNMLLGTDFLTL